MSNYATENLRTLALVGHGSCGKTTLIEAMLYRAGMIPEMGSIQRGTTMCDNDLLEKEVGHSIRLAVAHIDTAMTDLTPVRIHILDTPGYPDYLGHRSYERTGAPNAPPHGYGQRARTVPHDRHQSHGRSRG